MKITISPTTKLVICKPGMLEPGVPARIWEGETETTKYKYLIRVKTDYFRRKFPDFDSMEQRHKENLMKKEFEYLISILKEKSNTVYIFCPEDFNIERLTADVEIYPLEYGEEVKFEVEEVPENVENKSPISNNK